MMAYVDLSDELGEKLKNVLEEAGWFVSSEDEANLVFSKEPHPYKPTVIVGECGANIPDNVIDIIPLDFDEKVLKIRLKLYSVYLQSGDFETVLDEEFMKSRRYTLPLSVVIFRVLEKESSSMRKLVSVLNVRSRKSDKSFRISEDEIVVVLPGTDREGAEVFVKRVVRKYTKEYVRENVFKKPDFVYGIGSIQDWMISAEDLLSSAEFDLLQKLR